MILRNHYVEEHSKYTVDTGNHNIVEAIMTMPRTKEKICMTINTIDKLVPEIVKSLREISDWPWGIAEGNFITDNNGLIAAEVPCQGVNGTHVSFIASSPLWLAQMVVHCVRLQATVEEDMFFRWHQKTEHCSECFRKGLVEIDPRHRYDYNQWLSSVLESLSITESDWEWLKGKVGR